MPSLLLPVHYNQRITLVNEPTGQKQILLIPGASGMDGSQLREIIHWQQERFNKECQTPKPVRKYSHKEVGKALKEFREYARRRSGGKIYF